MIVLDGKKKMAALLEMNGMCLTCNGKIPLLPQVAILGIEIL